MTFVDAAVAPSRKTGQIKLHCPAVSKACARPGACRGKRSTCSSNTSGPELRPRALDQQVFDFAMAHKAYPAPLGYRGYRKSICTSINHVVCHGIPDAGRSRKPTS